MKASKEAIRKELAALRDIGGQMANLCFNLGQPGWTITDNDRKTMRSLQEKWDAVKRCERKDA